jgi:histidinol-phosphate phosphatase family protein
LTAPSYDLVVPTIGRSTLRRLLDSLDAMKDLRAGTVWVVADRPDAEPRTEGRVRVLPGPGRGPAAARNCGWRASSAEWIVFLDDDVVPGPGWATKLARDLDTADADVGGVQGRIHVPLPPDRRPTDWERNVAGLERARWATADMAYRRRALEHAGGFDERFPRAYREDADLALRIMEAGYRLTVGRRSTEHPVRPVPWTTPVRLQAGNADDVLMWALHGSDWRRRAGAPPGRLRLHMAATAMAALAVGGLARGRTGLAAVCLRGWAGVAAEFAWERIAPGPRTFTEVVGNLVTSVAIPFAAVGHWLGGWLSLPRRLRRGGQTSWGAVLLDRDGTLVVDVPYNGDPDRVRPVPGADRAVARLRRAGLKLAVVSNQSGVGRGLISANEVAAVNRRVERLLGPIGPWFVCTHSPAEGCRCRKPAPGLIVDAARRLGVPPERCVVIGDTGADVGAAMAVGARPILVPNEITRPEEVESAPEVASDLNRAVDLVLGEPG